MAIRNNKLGGSDFVNGEVLYDYDLDDTNNALIDVAAKGVAQNSYQTLKHAGTFDNKDNLGADRFTVTGGVNSTINQPSSESLFETNKYILGFTNEVTIDTTYDPNSATDPENAFDEDLNTYARKLTVNTFALGKTFTSSRLITWVKVKAIGRSGIDSPPRAEVRLLTYDGATWTQETLLSADNGSGNGTSAGTTFDGVYYLNSNVEGIAVQCYGSDPATQDIYELQYGDYSYSSSLIIDTNTLILTGNEKSICVYTDEVNTVNTNITYNVSDGTTTISDLALNTVNGIASLGSGQLEITFNLSTTDTSETPELYGYSYYIN